MPINTPRSEYVNELLKVRRVRDCVDGDDRIRSQRTTYLPAPPGLETVNDSDVLENGKRSTTGRYDFYLSFAEFPEIISPLVDGIQGLIHGKEPDITLPPALEYLREQASVDGTPLLGVWKNITRELLITGKVPITGDIMEGTNLAYMCLYPMESLINWNIQTKRDGGAPTFVVLKEQAMVPTENDPFVLERILRFRHLFVDTDGTYKVQVTESTNADLDMSLDHVQLQEPGPIITPSRQGNTFDFIPIEVINASILPGFEYGTIPIYPQCKIALSIYRKTADYYRSLYYKGDPQPWVAGAVQGEVPTEIGGSSIWAFSDPQAHAEYLDIDGEGIPLQRTSINDKYEQYSRETGRLFDLAENGDQSGVALGRRQAMQQVTVKSMVSLAAIGLVRVIRMIGQINGLSEQELTQVSVTPDLTFIEPQLLGQDVLNFINAKNEGAPLSQRSLHGIMRRGNLTTLPYEDELQELATEQPIVVNTDNNTTDNTNPADSEE